MAIQPANNWSKRSNSCEAAFGDLILLSKLSILAFGVIN
jgi:hypothetical protein